jgi:hypothetical protein
VNEARRDAVSVRGAVAGANLSKKDTGGEYVEDDDSAMVMGENPFDCVYGADGGGVSVIAARELRLREDSRSNVSVITTLSSFELVFRAPRNSLLCRSSFRSGGDTGEGESTALCSFCSDDSVSFFLNDGTLNFDHVDLFSSLSDSFEDMPIMNGSKI